jgi:hypothetical protein
MVIQFNNKVIRCFNRSILLSAIDATVRGSTIASERIFLFYKNCTKLKKSLHSLNDLSFFRATQIQIPDAAGLSIRSIFLKSKKKMYQLDTSSFPFHGRRLIHRLPADHPGQYTGYGDQDFVDQSFSRIFHLSYIYTLKN